MTNFVRLTSIELNNFKNVEHGEIPFPNYFAVEYKGLIEKPDVVGIYGQNGTGKTAVIEALDIAKCFLSGKSASFSEYAGIINGESYLGLSFFMKLGEKKFKVKYEVKLKVFDSLIGIPWEKITVWDRGANWKGQKIVEVINPYYEVGSLTSDVHATVLQKGDIPQYDFILNPDKLAVSCASKGTSFLFNPTLKKTLSEDYSKDTLPSVLLLMTSFADSNFFVIKVGQLAQINGRKFLPLNVKDSGDDYIIYGCIPLFLNGVGDIPMKLYEKLNGIIESINIALRAIIPNLKLEYNKVGEETDPNGLVLAKIELYSVRNGRRFSTKYESEGIKRIISLLSCLVSVYNNEGTTLVVDELDSGIFEFLLGEILYAIEKDAKGQLVFTSHNLRAFEKLHNDSIVCSTTTPANRYVRLTGINKNNNKRDFYIRALALGGQKEPLYDCDALDSIGYAFRRAGRVEV